MAVAYVMILRNTIDGKVRCIQGPTVVKDDQGERICPPSDEP